MANGINNKYEYRSGLLDSLNVQHTASDVRNEDEYRKKVLNGLGVEYTEDDINQKNLYRAKVVEGLASSGSGGGESDFSTAEVTIICNTGSPSISGWWIVDGMTKVIALISEGTTNLEAVLYKGENLYATSADSVSVSGNATKNRPPVGGGFEITITGDCTITINQA